MKNAERRKVMAEFGSTWAELVSDPVGNPEFHNPCSTPARLRAVAARMEPAPDEYSAVVADVTKRWPSCGTAPREVFKVLNEIAEMRSGHNRRECVEAAIEAAGLLGSR